MESHPLYYGVAMLRNLLTQYSTERDLSVGHENNLRRALRFYGDYIGREPICFDYETVNLFLSSILRTRSRETAKLYRRCIVTIWNYAADCGQCEHPITRRIKRIRSQLDPPRAFSVEDVARLIDAAGTLPGVYPWGTRADYWQALISGGVACGLRRGDLFRLPRSIDDGRPFSIVESKTGLQETRKLSQDAVARLRRLPVDNSLAYPWRYTRTSFRKTWLSICRRAEITGQFKMLRRSWVTYTGWRHRDPSVSRRYYVDTRLVDEPVPVVEL